MHLSSNTMLFISTLIWVLVFVFCFLFSAQFLSGMNSPYCSFWRGTSRKLDTEEKEDEEPGNSLDRFLQKCVSRQAEPNGEAGCRSAAPFTKGGGWRGRTTMCGRSVQRPSPIPGLTGKGRVRTWDRAHLYSHHQGSVTNFLVYFFPSLFTLWKLQGQRNLAVSFQYNWT